MFDKVYLLSADLCGAKNIDHNVKLSFYKQTVDKAFDMSGYRVKAIFGENGCGKTALITTFSIIKDIVLDGRFLTNKQNLLEELINKKEKKLFFSCEFIVCEDNGNTVYNYLIRLDHNDNGYYISREKLAKKNGNYVNYSYKDVFVVENGRLISLNTDNDVVDLFREESLNLLRNQSFLRTFISVLNKETEVNEYVHDMLNLLFFFVNMSVYIGADDKHDLYMLYNEIGNKISVNENIDSEYISDMLNMLTNTGDDKVRIESFDLYKKRINRMERFIRLFKPELVSIDVLEEKNADFYFCKLRFNYGDYTVDKEFESTGIKKLISVFTAIETACHGGIVFIDELDANINVIYLEKIIEYIIIYGDGQLCFSTHGLEIMDLLRSEKLAIDFLTRDKEIIHWTAKGNNSPINYYKKGFIKGIPYNIDSIDLIDIFMENNI